MYLIDDDHNDHSTLLRFPQWRVDVTVGADMCGLYDCVLNMGDCHGTLGIAPDANIVFARC